ncbi:dTMP kinase [Aliiglaciecola lipolytica]|uniref:Thymidylate kinase n=1 Tax=Aliiglaciecola lipolytica E3 TaxID=1127673 RepID=K6YDZ8_9ALTE|nr:dTMP kinase [Aliiglaciecola lipolytica]GAC14843.1 dTMP kinase [Aliiglaciecola lipolytica E3]
MSGKFIVIEGLEGAGKSSAIATVKKQLEAANIKVICTREPGGTPMAESIRDCVKHAWQEKVTIEAELLLMYAARVQLLENVIKPNLAEGTWVIGDRHDLSSQAYQGGGRGISADKMTTLSNLALNGFKPDFTLYLDVEPEEGLKRARGRGELDRIELENLSFFERTRARYLALCNSDNDITLINTMQSIDEVHNDIKIALSGFLKDTLCIPG